MQSFKKILVGVSCEAEPRDLRIATSDRHAFMRAVWIAARCGAEVRAFHVTDFVDKRLSRGSAVVRELVHQGLDAQLEAMVGAVAMEGTPTSHGFGDGKPWLSLLQEAKRWGADLIVVGAHRSEIGIGSRLLHGSTASRVIRKAPTPVLVVHPGADVGVAHVLACVDGSPVSERVLDAAHWLGELGKAKRTALRCLDYPDDIALRRLADADVALRQYHEGVRGDAQAELLDAAERTGGDWEVVLDDRYILDVVPSFIADEGVDLIVMASTSRGAIAGMLLGTTAERILALSTVSTLIMRPEGWKSPVDLEG